MPILRVSGRRTLAYAIKSQPIHVAWGLGDGVWLTPPSEDDYATGLLAETGRRVAAEVAFVQATPSGNIVMPSGDAYARTPDPTNILYVRGDFDFADAAGLEIREWAIFCGAVVNPSVPSAKGYLAPSDLLNPGQLLFVENIPPIFRYPNVRRRFEEILIL